MANWRDHVRPGQGRRRYPKRHYTKGNWPFTGTGGALVLTANIPDTGVGKPAAPEPPPRPDWAIEADALIARDDWLGD